MDTRVVHQDVDSPERPNRLFRQTAGGILFRDIAGNRAVPVLAYLRPDLVQRLLADIVEHESRAFAGEEHGGRAADSTARAGHDCNLILEPHGLASPSRNP
jgi:hypothetical protein